MLIAGDVCTTTGNGTTGEMKLAIAILAGDVSNGVAGEMKLAVAISAGDVGNGVAGEMDSTDKAGERASAAFKGPTALGVMG